MSFCQLFICGDLEQVAVVLFPTPETLESIEALAAVESRPLLLVNSQWQPGQVTYEPSPAVPYTSHSFVCSGNHKEQKSDYWLKRMGQVISDFGFGARRKTREDFVNSFEMVYFLKRMRMLGEDVRILRRYPGNWQVVPTLNFPAGSPTICPLVICEAC
jgi:hypothetical protein